MISIPRAPMSPATRMQSSRVSVRRKYSSWKEYRLTPRLMRCSGVVMGPRLVRAGVAGRPGGRRRDVGGRGGARSAGGRLQLAGGERGGAAGLRVPGGGVEDVAGDR